MEKKSKSKAWKIIKPILIILLVLILIVAAYFIYVFVDYHRIDDNQKLTIKDNVSTVCEVGQNYKIVSYNVGFGAYTPDFGFFMDGGTESRAASAESVKKVFDGITAFLKSEDPDFMMIEEVDIDSTRSYHVDQQTILEKAFPGYDSVFGCNYDSPFLFYPIFEPHGKSVSGIMTFSKFNMTDSLRRSLPIEESVMKLVDLDRCYTITRVPTSNGKELVLFTVHLSAYSSDGSIGVKQLKMLLDDMQAEYNKGNYCIAGGDFNKDLLGDGKITSADIFGIDQGGLTWAQPIDPEILKGYNVTKVVPFDELNKVPSCRNADGPYNDKQYVVTVDGFFVTDNVTVLLTEVYDTGFKYSDHNPVYMDFILGDN